MKTRIIQYIQRHQRRTVTLAQLEGAVPGDTSYRDFAGIIREMEASGLLLPVKSSGSNGKEPSLANAYRINRAGLNREQIREIAGLTLDLHPAISLDAYYELEPNLFAADWPAITRVDAYLKKEGMPRMSASIPERSYQLAGDEKWIDEQGGRQILERLGLWTLMRIDTVPEPLMLAVNPAAYSGECALHLVVENKASFHGLLPALAGSPFLSLVFGSGWKIAGNLHLLDRQLNWKGESRRIYYFGDLDWEGLSIWHRLQREATVPPALPFYRALLEREPAAGKENQRENPAALEAFAAHFTTGEGIRMAELLEKRRYYPQEVLEQQELQKIWREQDWNWNTGR